MLEIRIIIQQDGQRWKRATLYGNFDSQMSKCTVRGFIIIQYNNSWEPCCRAPRNTLPARNPVPGIVIVTLQSKGK